MTIKETNDGVVSQAWRTRAWVIVGALSVTEMVSWGILYYAFAEFLLPMQRELGYQAAQLAGAFSLALLGVRGRRDRRRPAFDRQSPRAVMTLGSIAGVALVLAWSEIHGLLAFYLLWAGIGVVMAAVLYEPAFVVLAKWFPEPGERRRAMTAMTLVAALASFIFLPLAQALIDAHGWRDALVVLAVDSPPGSCLWSASIRRRRSSSGLSWSARATGWPRSRGLRPSPIVRCRVLRRDRGRDGRRHDE